VEVGVTPEAPWMFGVVADRGRGKQREVPIFGYVPVEGVEGV